MSSDIIDPLEQCVTNYVQTNKLHTRNALNYLLSIDEERKKLIETYQKYLKESCTYYKQQQQIGQYMNSLKIDEEISLEVQEKISKNQATRNTINDYYKQYKL